MGHSLLLHVSPDFSQEVTVGEGLRHVAIGACIQRALHVLSLAASRKHHDWQASGGRILAESLNSLEAIQNGHDYVAEKEIRVFFAYYIKGLTTIKCDADVKTRSLKYVPQQME